MSKDCPHRHQHTRQMPKLGAEKGGYNNVSSAMGESEIWWFSKNIFKNIFWQILLVRLRQVDAQQ